MPDQDSRALVTLALPAIGLTTLYLPTIVSLAQGQWQTAQHSHGPIMLALACWLLHARLRETRQIDHETTTESRDLAGWSLLVVGLSIYIVGRSQSLAILEVSSSVLVLGGLLHLLGGRPLLHRAGFALCFLLLVMPIPGSVSDTLTQPLKLAVSWAAEQVLRGTSYPVARSGVVLTIAPYQLLVADACSGLSSLFMLEALGLFYLNVVRHTSVLRNLVLAVLIVPISFVSNVLRVLLLALVTVHAGETAGQGFVHQFTGVALFVPALLMIVACDAALRWRWRRKHSVSSHEPAPTEPKAPRTRAAGTSALHG